MIDKEKQLLRRTVLSNINEEIMNTINYITKQKMYTEIESTKDVEYINNLHFCVQELKALKLYIDNKIEEYSKQ